MHAPTHDPTKSNDYCVRPDIDQWLESIDRLPNAAHQPGYVRQIPAPYEYQRQRWSDWHHLPRPAPLGCLAQESQNGAAIVLPPAARRSDLQVRCRHNVSDCHAPAPGPPDTSPGYHFPTPRRDWATPDYARSVPPECCAYDRRS